MFIHTTRDADQVMPWLERLGFDVTMDERCGSCHAVESHHECPDCEGWGLLTFWNERGQLLVTNRKLPAVAYIDDRGIRFTSWEQSLVDLTEYESK